MINKLKCVLVDDAPHIHKTVEDLCSTSNYAELVGKFLCPKKFLDAAPTLDYDVCLLDLNMPLMDGFTVARMIKGKKVIFITGVYGKVPEALDISPVDIVLKPVWKDRFDHAIKKTYHLILGEKAGSVDGGKTHELFWVAELLGKVKVPLSEILYVKTDEIDYRNKMIHLHDGKVYTIMDHSFDDLIKLAPHLVQVNISELISVNILHDIDHNTITLKGCKDAKGMPGEVALGRAFKKKVLKRVLYA